MKNDYNRFVFWIEKQENQTIYFIRVNHEWIQVKPEVFSICRNSYRKINRDNKRNVDILCNYGNLDLAEIHSFEKQEINIIDLINKKTQIQLLHMIFPTLSNEEQTIIYLIYFYGKTEREVANIFHLSPSTLHNRKIKVLKKLKEFLEQNQI